MRRVGETLLVARRRVRLTQTEAARDVGRSTSSIANAEKGRQWLPVPILAALCALYKVSLAQFFERVSAEAEGDTL